jgi:hypothetical protein
MLGLGRLPEANYKRVDGITPRLQRVLNGMMLSPAIIKNAIWDVVGWNRAAAALLTDYSLLPPDQRNILRLMFTNGRGRSRNEDWDSVARFVVGAFRADMLRAGAQDSVDAAKLVEELSRLSPEFEMLWQDNDVVAHSEGVKQIRHPAAGLVSLEFSSFAVEGRPELGMIVYNPATNADAEKIRALVNAAKD